MYVICINFESISTIFLSEDRQQPILLLIDINIEIVLEISIRKNNANNIKHENTTKWEGRTKRGIGGLDSTGNWYSNGYILCSTTRWFVLQAYDATSFMGVSRINKQN